MWIFIAGGKESENIAPNQSAAVAALYRKIESIWKTFVDSWELSLRFSYSYIDLMKAHTRQDSIQSATSERNKRHIKEANENGVYIMHM